MASTPPTGAHKPTDSPDLKKRREARVWRRPPPRQAMHQWQWRPAKPPTSPFVRWRGSRADFVGGLGRRPSGSRSRGRGDSQSVASRERPAGGWHSQRRRRRRRAVAARTARAGGGSNPSALCSEHKLLPHISARRGTALWAAGPRSQSGTSMCTLEPTARRPLGSHFLCFLDRRCVPLRRFVPSRADATERAPRDPPSTPVCISNRRERS